MTEKVEIPNSSTEGLSESARERIGALAANVDLIQESLRGAESDVLLSLRAAVEFLAMGMLRAHIRIEHLTAKVEAMEALHHMNFGDVPNSIKHTHWSSETYHGLVMTGMDVREAAERAGSA